MANMIRKNESSTTAPTRRRSFDPWQALFNDPFGAMMPYGQERTWTPSFEVRETSDGFLFKADLPGVKESDVDIEVHGNRLAVSGKREDEHETQEGENVYAYERSYGTFYRAFTLPENADTDNISCDLKDGELKLVVPKKPGAKPRKIQLGKGRKA